MTDLTFDHLYPYAELTDALHGLAAAHPDLIELESAGHSHEGRDIWIATITNRATGPHDEKPALFVEANIHATEITASTAALHLVHHLATRHGIDESVTRALDRLSNRSVKCWSVPRTRYPSATNPTSQRLSGENTGGCPSPGTAGSPPMCRNAGRTSNSSTPCVWRPESMNSAT